MQCGVRVRRRARLEMPNTCHRLTLRATNNKVTCLRQSRTIDQSDNLLHRGGPCPAKLQRAALDPKGLAAVRIFWPTANDVGGRHRRVDREEPTMNPAEMLRIVDAIHRDKNIDKEIVFQAIESALVSATRRSYGEERVIEIQIDREDGAITGTCDGEPLDPEEIAGRNRRSNGEAGDHPKD